jgi:capsular polysaccharide biosynthesis protein
MDDLHKIFDRLDAIVTAQNALQADINSFTQRIEQSLVSNGTIITTLQKDLYSLKDLIKNSSVLPDDEWAPEEDINNFISEFHIRTVPSVTDESQGLLQRLKSTWIGKTYETHIKKYPIIHKFFITLWRNGYPLYMRSTMVLNRTGEKKWRRLMPLRTATHIHGYHSVSLLPEQQILTPTPAVIPAQDQNYLISPHTRYIFPEINVTTFENVTTYGGTNLILTDHGVVCHDLYDFVRDYTSEELHGRTIIQPQRNRISWRSYDAAPEFVPIAASFVDACAQNYAHWLTEVLPRIAVFCVEEQFKDVPLVINAGLHKNILSSLALIAGKSREIIALPIGRALNVGKLYVTSCAGYVPFERRNNRLSCHSHGMFSAAALELMCKRICSALPSTTPTAWPEKIYFRRNSASRNIVNIAEVEKLLFEHGYVAIDPEKLTFAQQFSLSQNAKKIIGATGAAMANIIFAPNTADIFIMISKNPRMIYFYWQNIACATGKKIHYILGDPVVGQHEIIHADFFIDVEMLQSEAGFLL